MDNKYSVKLIIRNKIGYRILIWICITLFHFSYTYFLFNASTFYYLTIIGFISCFVFLVIILINIKKIKYYFKNGIVVNGIIYKREDINHYFLLGIIYPSKFIVYYRYIINGETYSSSCKIIDKKDLAYLKDNTKIKILVNPSNKNDAIILDIFKK